MLIWAYSVIKTLKIKLISNKIFFLQILITLLSEMKTLVIFILSFTFVWDDISNINKLNIVSMHEIIKEYTTVNIFPFHFTVYSKKCE